ncbi:MAG TPA: hypothetical protein VG826_02700 [Pirellulales bacterium]|nr:hypothetical protein [Pirellulales bacterium]
MRHVRDWLSLAVLAGLTAVCLGSLRDAATRPVRPVDQLDHEQLFEWLSRRDLSGEFTHTKLRLARRLAEDFRQGADWQHDLAGLDQQGRDRLLQNFRELACAWLLERADRYASLGEPDRTAFIDQQLDDLLYWPVWQRSSTRDLAGLLPGNPALPFQQIDHWTDGVQAAQRQRIQQFTGALYLRWLQRGFQFLPGGV